MKNINKFMLTCMMMTLGSLNIEAQTFSASEEFKNQGFTIGEYENTNSTAFLKNSSSDTTINFENVVKSTEAIEGLTHIGYYLRNLKCPPPGRRAPAVMPKVDLYGDQVD